MRLARISWSCSANRLITHMIVSIFSYDFLAFKTFHISSAWCIRERKRNTQRSNLAWQSIPTKSGSEKREWRLELDVFVIVVMLKRNVSAGGLGDGTQGIGTLWEGLRVGWTLRKCRMDDRNARYVAKTGFRLAPKLAILQCEHKGNKCFGYLDCNEILFFLGIA